MSTFTPSILTIPKAAALIGVPYSTLWEWVRDDPVWQGCISHRNGRRVYLSTKRLRECGLLDDLAVPASDLEPIGCPS